MMHAANEWKHILEEGETAEDLSHLLNSLKKMILKLAMEEHVEFQQAVKKGDQTVKPLLERLLKSKQSIIFQAK